MLSRFLRHAALPAALLCLAMPVPASAASSSAIVPGELRADATFAHIGVRWSIGGDTNLNSTFALEFRAVGESEWRPAAPGMRAHPTLVVDGAPLNLNYWAASAMWLTPGQAYELRATLNDADGGGLSRTVTATVRSELQAAPQSTLRFVVPGNGGGDGSQATPFKGLQAAASAAQAGDRFRVAAGTYAPFQLLTSGSTALPIVFEAANAGSVVIDGAGTDRGAVTLGEFDRPIGFVIVEGFVIQNARWGVDLQNSHDIALRRNTIQNVDHGVLNRRGNGSEFNQTITDNTITGRTAWPGAGIPAERGIDLRGSGNVIAFNRVRNFGDCISIQPSTGASFGNDVHGNDAAYCVDDGIEMDYNQSNARVWRNRVMNARMGASVQPSAAGPVYIFRNEFFNLESDPIKMRNQTSGFYVLHNTSAKHDNGQGDGGAMWRNAVYRNNIVLGTRYAFEFTTTPDEGFRDFDYNAWGTTREMEGASAPYFKWNNVRYARLPNLQAAGVETHGIDATFAHLLAAQLPAAWNVAAEPGSRNLQLAPGAPEIDAGAVLPNVNEPFVIDGKPDMGAFEAGQPAPLYGPRVVVPNLPARAYVPLARR